MRVTWVHGGHKASISCSLFEKKGVNAWRRKIAEGRFIKRKSKPKKKYIFVTSHNTGFAAHFVHLNASHLYMPATIIYLKTQ
uniref:Uncharacterized protein n=1 Tax=Candidatus Methanogaster sp. ANME-2c ERB4 TaxID=2759911 RepID=A0A7G9Y6C0_9EURY|nr:hypothetical protein HMEJMANM_00023 [Methanosarcinales archaeon ANME-2c ERB4]QNO43621.1 hypothetical protein LAPIAFBC_00028 [Methanosarcinales archaeon ANME-2c ERB4]QNO44706.1 hypothetical protein LCOPCFJD_00005 [Methanosarcinales archaeon ANME-2c ERB4]